MQSLTEPKRLPPELAILVQMVAGLQATLGRTAEVVVHDFRTPAHSVIAIAGNVTGRKVGAPLTDRLLEVYRKHGDSAPDIINVRTRTRNGMLLRSTTVFIRNRNGKIVGSLGVNLDQSEYEVAARLLADVLGTGDSNPDEAIDFSVDVNEMMQSMIESGLALVGRPPQLLNREERVSLVRALETRGLFLIKGAVEEVAKRIGISRFTLYGYLDEVRKSAD